MRRECGEEYRMVPADLGKHELGVVYLNRYLEGDAPVHRFVDSYRRFPPGLSHDLVVIFKGFPDRAALASARAAFSEIEIVPFVLDDSEFDIGSYLQVAKRVAYQHLLFLNTFSKIMTANWLSHFSRALERPQVGLVGATGSLLANTAPYEAALLAALTKMKRQAKQAGTTPQPAKRRRPWSRYLTLPMEYLIKYAQYGRFPNPHIRTNAFMLDRKRFLSLQFPQLKTKYDVYRFESGRRSLTRQILAQGLSPVVVGRNGAVYRIRHWELSKTFWSGDQENLIVADNRTGDYEEADPELRFRLEQLAWRHPWAWGDRAPTG